jgi:AraC-like DNA-binding protein
MRALDQNPDRPIVADSCPASLPCCRRFAAAVQAKIWLACRRDRLAHACQPPDPARTQSLPRLQGPSQSPGSTLSETEDETASLRELARLFEVSPRHLHRLFRLAGLASPMREFRRQRLLSAYRELQFSKESLEELAEHSGFHDGATFSRAFKRAFGVSPGRLRPSDRKGGAGLAGLDNHWLERP